MLPGTNTEAAVQGALMAAGPLGVAAGKTSGVIGLPRLIAKALPFATEMGLPAAAGATSAAVQGEDVGSGAGLGLTGSIIAKTMGWGGSALGWFFNRLPRVDTPALWRRMRDIFGTKFTDTLTGDIPSLAGKGGRINF